MLKLFGWMGNPTAGSSGLQEYLTQAANPPLSCGRDTSAFVATGTDWICIGPCIAQDAGLTALVRGRPIWRTQEPRVLQARTDAQALLEAYRLKGIKFLELLHGSFALVVIDHRLRSVVLAIDRMGIERLAYSSNAHGLTFSTSAEVVARSPRANARIRPQALLSYLFFHMIPSPETAFEGVSKIAPATAVVLENGRLTEWAYWQPRFVDAPPSSYESLKRSLHGALEAGVREAQPNEATGAFLSGGLDSSTVAGYLGKVTGRPARTFSIGFGFDDYDELRYARIANAHFGCEAREYEVRPDDIVDLMPIIAREYDEPFGNASALPTYCCARLARESGVDHLLAGDGGDEIFAGNKRYAEQRVYERYELIPAAFRRGVLESVLGCVPSPLAVRFVRKARNYIAQAKTPMPDRLESWNFLHRLGVDAVLHPDFAAVIDCAAPLAHMRSVYASAPSAALLDRMLYYDWRFTLADNDLRKVGTMCELAGVRVSYPMLHPAVIDVSVRVPADLKMQGTELRTFYKRAMAEFLPPEIIRKPKHGFGLPFGLWLERSPRLAELVKANLAGLGARGLIRPQFLDQLRTLHGEEDARYYGVFVWILAMLEQWFQEHRLSP